MGIISTQDLRDARRDAALRGIPTWNLQCAICGPLVINMSLMLKGYITRWKARAEPEAHIIDYWFDSHPEYAFSWGTKEEAENECVVLDRQHIAIPSSEGGTHICSGFKVEQRAPKEFVVFCMAPFVVGTSGQAVRSA